MGFWLLYSDAFSVPAFGLCPLGLGCGPVYTAAWAAGVVSWETDVCWRL